MRESDIFFKHHLAQTTMFPFALEIERAEGIYLFDRNQKKYIDMVSGISVSHLGHGNRRINEAIKEQVDKHLHVMVYGEYLQQSQIKAATLLTDLLPPSLDCCYFVNSGAEANEAALKLAKRVTGRTRMIACKGAYHGSTHGALSVSGNEMKKAAFRPLLPDVHFIRFNCEEDILMIDERTACVIMETIQGDAGVRIPDAAYLQKLRDRCLQVGALLILDEIQCGMGRTGSLFAFESFGIVPDILTLGKALGGGLPVGCMVSSTDYMKKFTHDPMLGHISTFAGHPVVCAAVAASLEVMTQEIHLDEVKKKGDSLAHLLAAHPLVKEVRHQGLFFAMDLKDAESVQQVVERNLIHGLISFWFLSCPWSFRIAPPLTITEEEIIQSAKIILQSFDEVI